MLLYALKDKIKNVEESQSLGGSSGWPLGSSRPDMIPYRSSVWDRGFLVYNVCMLMYAQGKHNNKPDGQKSKRSYGRPGTGPVPNPNPRGVVLGKGRIRTYPPIQTQRATRTVAE